MLYPIKVRQIGHLNNAKLNSNQTIYVGLGNKYIEGSVLANTYRVKIHKRPRSLFLYRGWLKEAIKAKYEEYHELIRILRLARQHEITLVCYCVDSDDPDDLIYCHAQIIRNALIWLDTVIP